MKHKEYKPNKLELGVKNSSFSTPYSLLVLKGFFFLLTFNFILFTLHSTAAAAVLQRPANNLGLVGYWSFEDATGTQATDFSGNGYTGTLTNGPTWTNGVRGKAISFASSSNTGIITNFTPSIGTGGYSLSAWFKASTAQNGTIISTRYFYAGGNGQIDLFIDNAGDLTTAGSHVSFYSDIGAGNTIRSGTSPGNYTDGIWHHAVLTRNATSNYLFVDGSLVKTVTSTSQDIQGNGVVMIGGLGNGGSLLDGYGFTGQIDEVRIYNRALTATEVTTLYGTGAARVNDSLVGKGPTAGLVGHWTFDGPDMTTVTSTDRSGNGNNGTRSGGPVGVAGKSGQALKFDGTDDYVSVPDNGSLNLLSTLSVSFWLKYTTTSNVVVLEKSDNNTHFHFQINGMTESSGKLHFGISENNAAGRVESTRDTNDNLWHHYVGTFDTSVNTLKIYVDGALDNTNSSATNEPTSNSQAFLIASRAGIGAMPGTVDDVRIYNRALSVAEVQQLYRLGGTQVNMSQNAKQTSGLVGLWSFDGPDMTSVTSTDGSGNGYNGTLSGGPVVAPGKMGQALKFDGVDAQVVLPTSSMVIVNSSTPFSVAAWFKTSQWTPRQTIYSEASTAWNDVNYLFVTAGISDGTAEVGWFTRTGNDSGTADDIRSTATIYNDGAWHHVVATYNGSNKKSLYLDGVLNSSSTHTLGTFGFSPATNRAQIGALNWYLGNNEQPFNGSIDDVRTYNRALSASEVLQLYNLGK